jgi:YNFM family putative membrane transporter
MSATARGRTHSARHFAVGLAGYCAFINLYSPQSILPLLSEEFHASAAEVSTIITVSTLAVALTAPFTGAVADVLGRKRVIVAAMFVLVIPTLMVGLSTSLSAVIFWRAVQGLVLPPIFAVTVAYIGDEWPAKEATTAAGIYSSGSSLGGFSGRLVTGVIADLISWRAGFAVLAGVAAVGAVAVAFLLPRERRFVRSEGLRASGRQMLGHFRNSQLVATFAVGFGVLFNFICTIPIGSVLSPWIGWAVGRFGRRPFMVGVIAVWLAGIALTLAPSLPLIVAGLALGAGCGLICQAVSTGYVTVTAKAGRSSAVGLYVTGFYLGGSFGAAVGAIAWTLGGWPTCVALVAAMLVIMAAIVIFAWSETARQEKPSPIEPP